MARKRMFRLDVLETDAFMDMPLTTQALYFHLNMRADDDGFIGNPKQIVRLIGASMDDLKLLIAKRFVLTFEDGVIVIKHWRMHNTLSANRYKETNFIEDKAQLKLKDNKSYTFETGNLLNDDKLVVMSKRQTKDEQKTSAEENSIGKDRLDKGIEVKDIYKKNNNILPPLSPYGEKTEKKSLTSLTKDKHFPASVENIVLEWITYKKEKHQTYKETGFKNFLTQTENNLNEYGENAVVDAFAFSMAQNYQGVVWDRCAKSSKSTQSNSWQERWTK